MLVLTLRTSAYPLWRFFSTTLEYGFLQATSPKQSLVCGVKRVSIPPEVLTLHVSKRTSLFSEKRRFSISVTVSSTCLSRRYSRRSYLGHPCLARRTKRRDATGPYYDLSFWSSERTVPEELESTANGALAQRFRHQPGREPR